MTLTFEDGGRSVKRKGRGIGIMGAFLSFGSSFLILIIILLLIRTLEVDEIKIRIRSKIKRGTPKK
jgi:hypothetical protein